MRTNRRVAMGHFFRASVIAASAVAACGVGTVAHADTYPSKPIRLIVPYPAGGGTDTIARIMGNHLSTRLGQPVVIENKPGASGMLGNDLVAKAAPDGYTVLLGITAVVQIPALYKKVPYKLEDLAPVSLTAKSADLVMVQRSSGITTLQDFIAKVKAEPGKYSYGSYGNATSSHLHGEQLKMKAGIDLMHVPYQGSGPLAQAMLGGQITSAFIDATAAYPHLKSDKINILAVTGSQRHPALPNVPTMGESGIPGFEANGWFGYFVPAATPAPIVERLGKELSDIVKQPDISKRLQDMGLIAVGSLPAEFKKDIDRDAKHWKSIVDAAKISMD